MDTTMQTTAEAVYRQQLKEKALVEIREHLAALSDCLTLAIDDHGVLEPEKVEGFLEDAQDHVTYLTTLVERMEEAL